jgi:hypothetical protein
LILHRGFEALPTNREVAPHDEPPYFKDLALGAMLALPALASAQTARVAGLAVQGDYIKDYTGIFSYTSSINNVGNLIYGELGNSTGTRSLTSDRGVGFVMGNLWDGRWGTWSLHLREETPELGQGDANTSPRRVSTPLRPTRTPTRSSRSTSCGARSSVPEHRSAAEPFVGQ